MNHWWVDDITKFIFLEDTPQPADVILIPGGSYAAPAVKAAELWKQGVAHWVLPSGKYSISKGHFLAVKDDLDNRYPGLYETEWQFLRDVLVKNGVSGDAILKEDQAQYTYQNALFSKKVAEQAGLEVKRGIICCKSFHARRCYQYYQNSFPKAELLVCPVDIPGVSRKDWYLTPRGVKKVLGELERCGGQFKEILCGSVQEERQNDREF